MREIKFRAWFQVREDTEQRYSGMYEVAGIAFSEGIVAVVRASAFAQHLFPIGDVILMQFTGLHDKNGKEIYEGDNIRNGDKIDEVIFHQGCFCYKLADRRYHIFDSNKGEVIGNKWENPELDT